MVGWRWFSLGLVLLVSAPATVPVSGDAFVPQVPCSDPRGCPDLVVDESRFAIGTQRDETFPAGHCAVEEGMISAGTRHVMRFTFNTPNVGPGDLIIGRPSTHPEWFVYHPCHGHYHFREYADYRLWTVSGFQQWDAYRKDNPDALPEDALQENPELAAEMVAGNKMGFCVIDLYPAAPTQHGYATGSLTPSYTSSAGNQGISVGWADEYIFTLDGQWVDVTDVAAGAYVLESEVNAERLYREVDYSNNRAWLPVIVA